MSAFSATSDQLLPDFSHPRAVIVTQDMALDFYRLMQMTKSQHSATHGNVTDQWAAARRLYQTAIAEDGIHAFLTYRGNHAVGMVTFIRCLTEEGPALYLEDIVTDPLFRKRGVGKFGMAVLSRVAQERGYNRIFWECGTKNEGAQNFYTDLNADICGDRHTWRYFGTALGNTKTINTDAYLCRPLTPDDMGAVMSVIQKNGGGDMVWLEQVARRPDRDFLCYVTADKADGNVVGVAWGNRTFSTFREVNGIHLNGSAFEAGHSSAMTGILEAASNTQVERGCIGHSDITIQEHQRPLLGVLTERGYEPLKYGDDQMIVRSFGPAQIECTTAACHGEVEPDIITSVPLNIHTRQRPAGIHNV